MLKNINNRSFHPQTLASTFGGLVKLFENKITDKDLINNLNKILGDISNIIKIVSIKKDKNKKFTITIKAINPAYILQLKYQKNDILNKINNYYKSPIILKIIIK